MSLEQAYDTAGFLRPTLHAFKEEYVHAVRTGLETVLHTRDLTVGDYERLTDIEFEDEDALYDYFTSMYEYLFEAGEKQPLPPG
ncbi:hypothetical protein [Streptomyces cinereospinus]|uniref:Uncharacterized protein n=1 Tax=Streptomyces cinereospinus TaxID=285561 RepID=A0ABV5NC19_9ACTN